MPQPARPERKYHYQHPFMDTGRWDRFRPRDGDIVVDTAYKTGTTWMQMICALLIFQKPDLGRPLSDISPWLDMRVQDLDEVLAVLEAQDHRRIIKTHAPLDALPYYDNVTYMFVGRDPRDVFVSWLNHQKNMDASVFQRPEDDDLAPRPEIPEDPCEFFHKWMTTSGFPWEQEGWPSWSMLRHAETFWSFRHLPNIHMFHFSDLKADLNGEMRRAAEALGIEVPGAKWPDLVNAARFDSMKKNADLLAPAANLGLWRQNKRFFNKGTSGQWRDLLGDEELDLYRAVMERRLEPDLATWLENGSTAAST
jgi:aryl sulfotransferase